MVSSISKAHWNSDGENLRLSMPLTKVDEQRRIVSGFASLDNLDKQMDIVTSEASMSAFAKFRGNIREMHQPSAIGKMVDFKEDKYFDPETKKFILVFLFLHIFQRVHKMLGKRFWMERILVFQLAEE